MPSQSARSRFTIRPAASSDLPTVRELFEEADDVVGYGLTRLCFEGPIEELTRTDRAQPAIYLVAAAAVSGGDPIRTGFTAFFYSLRTVALPFLFIYNPTLILYGVDLGTIEGVAQAVFPEGGLSLEVLAAESDEPGSAGLAIVRGDGSRWDVPLLLRIERGSLVLFETAGERPAARPGTLAEHVDGPAPLIHCSR